MINTKCIMEQKPLPGYKEIPQFLDNLFFLHQSMFQFSRGSSLNWQVSRILSEPALWNWTLVNYFFSKLAAIKMCYVKYNANLPFITQTNYLISMNYMNCEWIVCLICVSTSINHPNSIAVATCSKKNGKMQENITYKKWKLKPGRQKTQVLFVSNSSSFLLKRNKQLHCRVWPHDQNRFKTDLSYIWYPTANQFVHAFQRRKTNLEKAENVNAFV